MCTETSSAQSDGTRRVENISPYIVSVVTCTHAHSCTHSLCIPHILIRECEEQVRKSVKGTTPDILETPLGIEEIKVSTKRIFKLVAAQLVSTMLHAGRAFLCMQSALAREIPAATRGLCNSGERRRLR